MPRINYVAIDAERINTTCDMYFKWKDLNTYIRNLSRRGINMPDAISEPIGCYCYGFLWNRGTVPGDATDIDQQLKIEFKATSNYDADLTSFGPDTRFDALYFMRFDVPNNKVYIYDLGVNSEEFRTWRVSRRETVGDWQDAGKRPHVRIIETIIEPNGLEPEIVFDIRRMQVIEDNR